MISFFSFVQRKFLGFRSGLQIFSGFIGLLLLKIRQNTSRNAKTKFFASCTLLLVFGAAVPSYGSCTMNETTGRSQYRDQKGGDRDQEPLFPIVAVQFSILVPVPLACSVNRPLQPIQVTDSLVLDFGKVPLNLPFRTNMKLNVPDRHLSCRLGNFSLLFIARLFILLLQYLFPRISSFFLIIRKPALSFLPIRQHVYSN